MRIIIHGNYILCFERCLRGQVVSKELSVEALKYTEIAPLIGTAAGSVIYKKEETEKGKGDQVTFGLSLQMAQDGFTENEIAEGNGESLTIYTDRLVPLAA